MMSKVQRLNAELKQISNQKYMGQVSERVDYQMIKNSINDDEIQDIMAKNTPGLYQQDNSNKNNTFKPTVTNSRHLSTDKKTIDDRHNSTRLLL